LLTEWGIFDIEFSISEKTVIYQGMYDGGHDDTVIKEKKTDVNNVLYE
jgi:hypothetical protein